MSLPERTRRIWSKRLAVATHYFHTFWLYNSTDDEGVCVRYNNLIDDIMMMNEILNRSGRTDS